MLANECAKAHLGIGSQLLIERGAAIDAVCAVVAAVELDPDCFSAGYGGLPNCAGVVELDATVMDGSSGRSGSVLAIQDIRQPSAVARRVLDATEHAVLAGDGARQFAISQGFQPESLVTRSSRKAWLDWKIHRRSPKDWPKTKSKTTFGTVACLAIDSDGCHAGCISTSGLSFKLPGRVSDSGLVGAGIWVEDEIGSACATGFGEAAIWTSASHSVVGNMKRGMTPAEACFDVCTTICRKAKRWNMVDPKGRFQFNVALLAVRADRLIGGSSIWPGKELVVSSPLKCAEIVQLKPVFQINRTAT